MSTSWLRAAIKLDCAAALLVLVVAPLIAAAHTVRVPADEPTIQQGIAACSDGDTVLVAPGTYIENVDFAGKNIVLGSRYLLTGDDVYIDSTIISGNDTAPAVVFQSGEDTTAMLTGFTVTHGRKGIYCKDSSPTIVRCRITRNTSFDYGGGIYCEKSRAVIRDVDVSGNVSYYDGAGIYFSESPASVAGSRISGNNAYGGDGGGVYIRNNSAAHVMGTSITGNRAGWYGGGVSCNESSPVFDSVTVSGNTSLSWYGGGFYFSRSKGTIRNSIIAKNKVNMSVGTGSGGGGICAGDSSKLFLSGVTVSRNWAKVGGGGMYLTFGSVVSFDTANRCNIYMNEALVGFDIYSYDEPVNLVVDTFTVMNPRWEQAFPISNFTFDILHAKIAVESPVLYVSPGGDNMNSGLSWEEPLRTIGFAKAIIKAGPDEPAVIYADSGVFSAGTNGEAYELSIAGNISIKGRGVGKTILEGDGSAGILFYSGAPGDTVEDLTMLNGSFGLGGGIYCSNSSLVLKNIEIRNCQGIEGGAIYSSQSSKITLINVLLAKNRSISWGGALYGNATSFDFINVTMAGNLAGEYGNGIYADGGDFNIMNSIFWNPGREEIYGSGRISIGYSDLREGESGVIISGSGALSWLTGTNLDVDPGFVDPQSNNFRLADSSGCIGTGTGACILANVWYFAPAEDMENNARPRPLHSRPDIGAIESRLERRILGVDGSGNVPLRFELSQNYPNPFNPGTVISYKLPALGHVSLKVYDVLGRLVKTLVNQVESPGSHEVAFNAADLPSGVYLYRIEVRPLKGTATTFMKTMKLMMLK